MDLSDLVGKGVFALWGDSHVFEQVRIGSFGELVWGDQIDLCPDSLYLRATGKKPEDVFPALRREAACEAFGCVPYFAIVVDAGVLNFHKVEYLLIGGYAVGYHGFPRATAGIDIWIAINPQNAVKMVKALEKFGFKVPELSTDLFLHQNKGDRSYGWSSYKKDHAEFVALERNYVSLGADLNALFETLRRCWLR